ncbi:MAG: DUF460 domain-containing protein [Candidatus Micrarchaeaceae archaeon]
MHLIVGVDGGKTAAIAFLDLNGELEGLYTGRFVSLSWFVDKIKQAGVPVIIASDKKKPERVAKRLAAIFSAELFTPNSDISTEKKSELAGKTGNLHERDALAAARAAYNAHANKLKQIDKFANMHGADADKLKSLVIARRYSMHEAAIGSRSGRSKRLI